MDACMNSYTLIQNNKGKQNTRGRALIGESTANREIKIRDAAQEPVLELWLKLLEEIRPFGSDEVRHWAIRRVWHFLTQTTGLVGLGSSALYGRQHKPTNPSRVEKSSPASPGTWSRLQSIAGTLSITARGCWLVPYFKNESWTSLPCISLESMQGNGLCHIPYPL